MGGNEVLMLPEAIVSPEVVLFIQGALDYSQPMPKATIEDVRNFCGQTPGVLGSYLANSGPVKNSISDSLLINTIDESQIYSVMLFPNPAQLKTTILLSQEILETEIKIFDLTGREVNVEINNQGRKYDINLVNLIPGLYQVRVINELGSVIKSLVIK